MRLTSQRRLTAVLLKCSPKRVRFKTEDLSEIKEAITKADLRSAIKKGQISKIPARGISRSRIRDRLVQKRKGRQRGQGSRKGKQSARADPKQRWVHKVRLQRRTIKELKVKGNISQESYKMLYRKVKGGFFRNKRHLLFYVQERGMQK